jgi:hypothetical protein
MNIGIVPGILIMIENSALGRALSKYVYQAGKLKI